MASRCPVLSSNQSCLPEVLGDAGILVNPYNINEIVEKMFELLNNENLRKEYIEKGLSRVQEFTWDNVARRLLQVYNKIM
jgi:glycosyltransferase involved in cell wall biosynthesis